MSHTVAIIGGGISGLTTAFYIQRARPEARIHLFERAQHLGGTMYTVEVDGYLFEIGSNGFLTNKPDTLDLVRESGAEDLLLPSSDEARIRYIYTDRLHRLPESPIAFLRTGLLSLHGKLRTLGEVFVPPRPDASDETLRDFGYRRVGREFTDVFLNAMSAGIYAASPETLSVNAAFPAVVALERDYGGLFRGMFKKRKRQTGPGGILMSFKGGVGRYIDHLERTLDVELHTAAEVTGLARTETGYRVDWTGGVLEAEEVVLATPAYAAARILEDLDPHMAMQLGAIDYSPVAVVGLGYTELAHPLHGFGLLTTASAGKEVLGVLWDSSIFPDRAPPGARSLRVMIGGQRNPELALQDEERLLQIAIRGVLEIMGVARPPSVTFVQRWEQGIPNYKVGHLAVVDAIFEKLHSHPGLHLSSNAYYGIGLNDCVRNARECAQRVTARIAPK